MRRLRIGRSDANEIVVPDPTVSRHHAELTELGGGRFTLTDLGSTFGTHVWQNQTWVPAAGTEIGADTVVRFGEFRTTLLDVLSESDRVAMGLPPTPAPAPVPPPKQAPAPQPLSASPAAAPPPRARTAPPPGPRVEPAAAPIAQPETQQRGADRPLSPIPSPARRAMAAAKPGRFSLSRRHRSLMLGLIGVGAVFAVAFAAIVWVLSSGEVGEPRRPDRTDAAAEGPRKVLEACTGQWGIEERRCRCFLAAAGANLQSDDYDDFADVIEAYVTGESDRAETIMQTVGERRGQPAQSRISAAFRTLVRDCPQ